VLPTARQSLTVGHETPSSWLTPLGRAADVQLLPPSVVVITEAVL
jgi:hypothetical protein